jgi:hypothetical protein
LYCSFSAMSDEATRTKNETALKDNGISFFTERFL